MRSLWHCPRVLRKLLPQTSSDSSRIHPSSPKPDWSQREVPAGVGVAWAEVGALGWSITAGQGKAPHWAVLGLQGTHSAISLS